MYTRRDDGPTRVVVVDDDPAMLALVGDVLAADGWEVWRCRGADGALPLIEAAEPDAIVLDLYMDGEERGLDILRQLKAQPRTCDIPVFLYSSAVRSLLEHEPLLRRHGVRTLSKPFDLYDLVAMLRRMTAGERQQTR